MRYTHTLGDCGLASHSLRDSWNPSCHHCTNRVQVSNAVLQLQRASAVAMAKAAAWRQAIAENAAVAPCLIFPNNSNGPATGGTEPASKDGKPCKVQVVWPGRHGPLETVEAQNAPIQRRTTANIVPFDFGVSFLGMPCCNKKFLTWNSASTRNVSSCYCIHRINACPVLPFQQFVHCFCVPGRLQAYGLPKHQCWQKTP
jgi:hypothetical protein